MIGRSFGRKQIPKRGTHVLAIYQMTPDKRDAWVRSVRSRLKRCNEGRSYRDKGKAQVISAKPAQLPRMQTIPIRIQAPVDLELRRPSDGIDIEHLIDLLQAALNAVSPGTYRVSQDPGSDEQVVEGAT